jgi:hypothetical protein
MESKGLTNPDRLSARIPQMGFEVNGAFNKSKKTREIFLVGAPRFELGTSCAQGRRNISWKSFLFNLRFENKRVRKIFGSGTMYGNVAAHAWSPPNFPHSEEETKWSRPPKLAFALSCTDLSALRRRRPNSFDSHQTPHDSTFFGDLMRAVLLLETTCQRLSGWLPPSSLVIIP